MHGDACAVALTRAVSPTLGACELTHLAREPIDVARAAADHAAYEDALRTLGATVVRVAPAPDLPDAVFVEDAAIVLDEVAVITRPGAPSRRGETAAVADALGAYRALTHIRPPATIDGGDVLRVGRTLYVGQSSRTNAAAIAQLAELLTPWDYRIVRVTVKGCLHLKSAITEIGDGVLLANVDWVEIDRFAPCEVIAVSDDEPGAANALRLGEAVVFPAHHPRTARRLERAGVRVIPVPCAELAKAEGGVTCCSLLVETKGTTSTYNVHLAFQGNVVPPVADSGKYTATSSGSFSETSSVDGSQVTGTYTDANNMLTVNLTTVVGAITQTWQKQ